MARLLRGLLKILKHVSYISAGVLVIVVASFFYIGAQVIHPDAVYEEKRDDGEEAETFYIIGDMHVGVSRFIRLNMKQWQRMVNRAGKKNESEEYKPIDEEEGDSELSLKNDNPDASGKPLVVILDIFNDEPFPRKISYKQFTLVAQDGKKYKPSDRWQKKLASAHVDSGADVSSIFPPYTQAKMVLVFPVDSPTWLYADAYIMVNYGSEDDFWAQQVEFPLTPSDAVPIGDIESVRARASTFMWIGIVSFITLYLLNLYVGWKRETEEYEEEED